MNDFQRQSGRFGRHKNLLSIAVKKPHVVQHSGYTDWPLPGNSVNTYVLTNSIEQSLP